MPTPAPSCQNLKKTTPSISFEQASKLFTTSIQSELKQKINITDISLGGSSEIPWRTALEVELDGDQKVDQLVAISGWIKDIPHENQFWTGWIMTPGRTPNQPKLIYLSNSSYGEIKADFSYCSDIDKDGRSELIMMMSASNIDPPTGFIDVAELEFSLGSPDKSFLNRFMIAERAYLLVELSSGGQLVTYGALYKAAEL